MLDESKTDRHNVHFVSCSPCTKSLVLDSDIFLGERQKAKKSFPLNNTSRRLAPRPMVTSFTGTQNLSESEPLVQGQNGTSKLITTCDKSKRGSQNELQDQRKTKEAAFTFSSAQTFIPDHDSLIPKRLTPYSNILTLMKDHPKPTLWPHGVTSTLAACLFNARLLGIDLDQLLDPRYMSPFYQPSSLQNIKSSSSDQLIAFENVSDPNLAVLGLLKPCLTQLIFPHHACIDLLPLPQLRETAVMLDIRFQQEENGVLFSTFDSTQELKKDVYLRQGVRFRGTGELRAKEYILHDGTDRHCGNPWESASWAVAPWLARKWKFLLNI